MAPDEPLTKPKILVLGSFVADINLSIPRLPAWGETLLSSGFTLGPGGKGSNQAVAAARAGGDVQILTRLGSDSFGQIARDLWNSAGIDASLVSTADEPTGCAAILIDQQRGENGIVISPGACFTLSPGHVDEAGAAIRNANVLLTQLELPLPTVAHGLRLAHEAGVTTILNPAPAPNEEIDPEVLSYVNYLIPNESEASRLTGLPVSTMADAAAAAVVLRSRGARCVIVTMGEQGALFCPEGEEPTRVPAVTAGPVKETTGAGDAFCGAFAVALTECGDPKAAVRFASAAAGLSVTAAGAAPSMPYREEIQALLRAQSAPPQSGK